MTDGPPAPHAYVSTACVHGECGACRSTCKYCDAPCSHACHPASARGLPEPGVDQAREMALLLLAELSAERRTPELWQRIASDPGLFWLRGEVRPPGEWRGAGKPPAVALLEEALFLRANGEYAPGGNENWHDWDLKAETFLRSLLPPEQEGV